MRMRNNLINFNCKVDEVASLNRYDDNIKYQLSMATLEVLIYHLWRSLQNQQLKKQQWQLVCLFLSSSVYQDRYHWLQIESQFLSRRRQESLDYQSDDGYELRLLLYKNDDMFLYALLVLVGKVNLLYLYGKYYLYLYRRQKQRLYDVWLCSTVAHYYFIRLL